MITILLLVGLTSRLVAGGIQPTFPHDAQVINLNKIVQSSDTEFDFSGEWIDTNGRRWNISRQDNKIIFVGVGHQMVFQGILEGRVIKYVTYTRLMKNKVKECKDFSNTSFRYEARLILSEDGDNIENKVHDSVSKGSCILNMKTTPKFMFTRIKAT